MRDLNRVTLIGRLGADPVMRRTQMGTAVTHFPVATSRKVKKDSEPNGFGSETQWHQVVVWGKQGEQCAEDLKKGHAVMVEGHIRSHKYTGKDGIERRSFEVHADSVHGLSDRVRKIDSAESVFEEAS